jgi:diaminopimelate epimerase
MHGLSNDYVFTDTFTQPCPKDPAALSVEISKYHTGIGADGLILIEPVEGADARMRIFNADGSEAQICGNGLRCVGKYLYDSGIVRREKMCIMTGAGLKTLTMTVENGKAVAARADMGEPQIIAARKPIEVCGRTLHFTCISMGNPHAITFEETAQDESFYKLGPVVERHEFFPERTNVEFTQVESGERLIVRVWERGSGETMACGSGACATLVAAVVEGLADRRAQVVLPGGVLLIEWNEEDNHVYMTGPAESVFAGEYPVEF